MSLGKLLEQIKQNQVFIDEDTNSGPYETMPARRGRQNQAIESTRRLRREYTAELRNTAAYILVLGDKKSDFTSLASEHFKCFVSDPNAFYVDLANRIPESLYMGKEGLPNLFDIIGRHLEDKALELNLLALPMLLYRQQYQRTIRNKEDFYSLIKEAVVEQIGAEMVGIQAAASLTNEAIKKDHAAKFTPILLPTDDEKFALTVAQDLERITKRVFIIATGKVSKTLRAYGDFIAVKEPTMESVEAALQSVSSKLKR